MRFLLEFSLFFANGSEIQKLLEMHLRCEYGVNVEVFLD